MSEEKKLEGIIDLSKLNDNDEECFINNNCSSFYTVYKTNDRYYINVDVSYLRLYSVDDYEEINKYVNNVANKIKEILSLLSISYINRLKVRDFTNNNLIDLKSGKINYFEVYIEGKNRGITYLQLYYKDKTLNFDLLCDSRSSQFVALFLSLFDPRNLNKLNLDYGIFKELKSLYEAKNYSIENVIEILLK
ncbi:MAG: hypothetical protein QXX36_01975 [Candidatus Rehaiarchaeum fermentans]|nr:hypothetical protein [Candidatus Rehaiarchaeum fermentans]MCW1297301.1 hypothetical protein [Candidatus Rehaiarchaeum fermentans]MCW1302373.1 hypothetical protein [Candidatus Rehaiarchaeum fermentans]